MKKIICRLRRLLIYVFKEIPVVLLVEIWAIARALSIISMVVYIIIVSFYKNNIDASILSFFKIGPL